MNATTNNFPSRVVVRSISRHESEPLNPLDLSVYDAETGDKMNGILGIEINLNRGDAYAIVDVFDLEDWTARTKLSVRDGQIVYDGPVVIRQEDQGEVITDEESDDLFSNPDTVRRMIAFSKATGLSHGATVEVFKLGHEEQVFNALT